MNKVIVIGCPGSGKSTFSKTLSKQTKLPLYHLDAIWHKEDKTTISREAFDVILNNLLNESDWIIDGNYNRTLECRLQAYDTIFLFDLPPSICLEGAYERIGKKRDDMPWIETEVDEEFKAFIENFPKDSLPYIYSLLNKYKDKQIIIFKSRDEVNSYLEKLTY